MSVDDPVPSPVSSQSSRGGPQSNPGPHFRPGHQPERRLPRSAFETDESIREERERERGAKEAAESTALVRQQIAREMEEHDRREASEARRRNRYREGWSKSAR